MDALESNAFTALRESHDHPARGIVIEEKTELLPLDCAERTVVFRSGGKPYRHIFRRFTAADWENFFAHVVAEFKRETGGFTQVVDMDYASLVLYARAILRVEGYQTRDGSKPEENPR